MAGRSTLTKLARTRLATILQWAKSSDVFALDREVRARSRWRPWHQLSDVSRAVPNGPREVRAAFLCLALCHPSGHVRQGAVSLVAQALPKGPLGAHAVLALRLLVVRRNDWVAAVAEDASTALESLLGMLDPMLWVEALPIVESFSSATRRNHDSFQSRVRAQADSSGWRPALRAALWHRDQAVTRAAVHCLMQQRVARTPELFDELMKSVYGSIRLRAVRELAEELPPERRVEVLGGLDTDPCAPIRAEALALRRAWFPESILEAYERALFDASASLRMQAQYELGKFGGSPRDRYTACLLGGEGVRTRAALRGLTSVGDAGDVDLVEPYLRSASPRVRECALIGVARLGGSTDTQRFLPYMLDPAPRVVRAAAAVLASRARWIDPASLVSMLQGDVPAHALLHLVRVIVETGPWFASPSLLTAVKHASGTRRERMITGVRAVMSRFRQWPRSPTPAEVDNLERALTEAKSELDGALKEELEFLLQTAKQVTSKGV